MENYKNQNNLLHDKNNQKSKIESVFPIYGRISVSRPLMLLIAYCLTLLLALNMNTRHRRFRMDFIRYIMHNYIIQL